MDGLAEVGAFFGFGVTEDPASMQRNDSTANVTPEFILTLEPDIAGAKREGRPVYRDRETVILHVAGDQFNAVALPVDDGVKRRFPAQYEAWKSNREARLTVSGTPLQNWPVIGPAQVAELNAMKVFNVEGLANIADVNLNKSPTLRELRTKAIAWLAQAKGGAEVTRLATENEALQAKLSEQADMLKALQEQMAELIAHKSAKAKAA